MEMKNTMNTSELQTYFKTKKMKQVTFEFVATLFDQIDPKFFQHMKYEEHNFPFLDSYF